MERDFLEVRPICEGTTDLDIAYRQAQGPEAIFEAAWQMVVLAHELKGGTPDELRIQRPHVEVRSRQD